LLSTIRRLSHPRELAERLEKYRAERCAVT
jgi:hypothetical protein